MTMPKHRNIERLKLLYNVAVSKGCKVSFEEFVEGTSPEKAAQQDEESLRRARLSGATIVDAEMQAELDRIEVEFFEELEPTG